MDRTTVNKLKLNFYNKNHFLDKWKLVSTNWTYNDQYSIKWINVKHELAVAVYV